MRVSGTIPEDDRRRRRAALALCLVLSLSALLPASGWAARAVVRGSLGLSDYPEFALHLFSRDLGVDYLDGGGPAVIETQAYALSFLEPVTPRTRVGFVGGRLDVSQPGRTATRGMTLGGYFLALTARSDLELTSILGLRGQFELGYANVDGRTNAQTTSLSWTEMALALDLALRPLDYLRLLAGNRWTLADGRERTFGAIDATTDFEVDWADSQRLGVEFLIDRSGVVGATLERGAQEGIRVYFQRRFD